MQPPILGTRPLTEATQYIRGIRVFKRFFSDRVPTASRAKFFWQGWHAQAVLCLAMLPEPPRACPREKRRGHATHQ
jgi:hypothetical protein